MKQIKLLFLLASASVTGVFAQSNGLTDMSQSRYAKMANTGINAVHWTNGFWGERFNVFSGTSLQSMWNTWNTPEVSHGFRNFESAAGVCPDGLYLHHLFQRMPEFCPEHAAAEEGHPYLDLRSASFLSPL